MHDLVIFAAATIIGYLLGSIPFGLILTHLAGAGDIRSIGSGNIGATNVLRTGRKSLALATLLLDAGKGALAVILCSMFVPTAGLVAGFFAFFGHIHPVWLRFRGGKGVATAIGIFFALDPLLGLFVVGTWLIVAVAFRYSSLAALAATVLSPIYAQMLIGYEAAILLILMALLIFWKHRSNIARLRAGTEVRIGSAAKKGKRA